MKNKKIIAGQGLIEVIFSIGMIILVLTGVVSLMTSSLNSRSVGFDRKKAAELGQKVIEQVVADNKTNSEFWVEGSSYWLALAQTNVDSNFPRYTYRVLVTAKDDSYGCVASSYNCIEVTVGVGWSGTTNQSLSFSRFFAKNK